MRNALWLTFATSAAFTAFALISTQDRVVRVHSPWQDDPYDAVVSFTMFFVPLLVLAGFLRCQLCRADRPLPATRLLDLLRCADAALAAIVATVATDWIAVAQDADRAGSGPLREALAALTVLLCVAAILVARAHIAARRASLVAGAEDADWLDDLYAVAELAAPRLGPLHSRAARTVARSGGAVVAVVRQHRVAATLAAAATFGVGLQAPLLLSATLALGGGRWRDGGLSAAAAAVLAIVGTAGMFVLLTGAGAYVRFVRPSRPQERGALLVALTAAAAVPLALAFREHLWWLVGSTSGRAGLTQLALLLLVAAVGGSTLAVAVGRLARRSRRGRPGIL